MVFVSVGTQKQDFSRIFKLVENSKVLENEEIIGQSGYTKYESKKIKLIPFIKKEFNPNIIESINRLSNIAYEEEEYIQKIVKKEFKDLLLDTSEEMKKNSNFGVENNYIGNNIIIENRLA